MNNLFKSYSGESISETLVALLISCVAMLMLATMIATSTKLVANSRGKMDDYYNKENTRSLSDNTKIKISASGSLGEGDENTTSITGIDVEVNYYKNNEFGNSPVLSYSVTASS